MPAMTVGPSFGDGALGELLAKRHMLDSEECIAERVAGLLNKRPDGVTVKFRAQELGFDCSGFGQLKGCYFTRYKLDHFRPKQPSVHLFQIYIRDLDRPNEVIVRETNSLFPAGLGASHFKVSSCTD
jgi:hypothetical protein